MRRITGSHGLILRSLSRVGVITGPTGDSSVTDGFYGFRVTGWASGDLLYGTMVLRRWDTAQHKWLAQGTFNDATNRALYTGEKTTSEVLTSIRLTTPGGTANFDAGAARVRYR